MKKNKFIELWNASTIPWMNSSFEFEGEKYIIKDYCNIKEDIVDTLFLKYEKIKQVTKDCYFQQNDKDCHLSRYKRAAVLMYAILLSNPLIYLREDKQCDGYDILFLKQRLAFSVAISSIVQDYPKDEVKKKINQENCGLFDFKSLDTPDIQGDDFLLSVYKDLFFSEIFENFNVLTMANLLGVLSKKVSLLSEIDPICSNHI